MKTISVLFVDDEPDMLKSISEGLNAKGFKVITADSGVLALNILNSFKPDIIITDLRMEPMNGFDFYQEVKKKPEFVDTPFIFLTAIGDYIAEKYSKDLGVNSYLIKPVELDKLTLTIKSNLSL